MNKNFSIDANHLTCSPRPKAFSYIRFSTKRQQFGDSLRRQLEKTRKYAAKYNLDLEEKTFEDLGISAFDSTNLKRGALAAFITAANDGKIPRGSYLLVESLDRLSRADVSMAVSMLFELVNLGIRVVALIDEKILDEESVKDPLNLMYAVLLFIRANEESETKSHRIKAVHSEKRAKKHSFAFGQGPGWLQPNIERNGWDVIPDKAESVRKVFEYTVQGYGAVAIARIANEQGWPVPGRAEDWHKTLPNKLVCNRRVLGEFEPSTKEGNVRVKTGDLWENYYPPIISDELFLAANAAVARRHNLPKRRDMHYHNVFQGMLKCGHCGATMARKLKSGSPRNSPGYALYVCSNRDRGLTKCPNANAKNLETSLIPPLITLIAAEIVKEETLKKTRNELEAEQAALNEARKAAENILRTIEQVGATEMLAKRMRQLEVQMSEKRVRIEALAANKANLAQVTWEEDIDAAIYSALKAVRDITDEHKSERASLREDFLRVIQCIWVWPCVHAAVKLHAEPENIYIPLQETSPIAEVLAGLLITPSESANEQLTLID